MTERADRKAKNEALARQLNERVHTITNDLVSEGLIGNGDDRGEYLCECADITCTNRIALSQSEYEVARSNPIWFVVEPGHEDLAIERVVAAHARYAIVEKDPGERAIAEATDPRS